MQETDLCSMKKDKTSLQNSLIVQVTILPCEKTQLSKRQGHHPISIQRPTWKEKMGKTIQRTTLSKNESRKIVS